MTTKLALLHAIVLASNVDPGYKQITQTPEAMELHSEGLIEINGAVPGLSEGHYAARATPDGINFAQANPEQPANAGGSDWGAAQTGQTGTVTNFGDAAAAAAQTNSQTGTTQTQTPANTGPAFVTVSGVGFAPSAPAKREGVKRDAPEKYPFGELKAPTKNADGSISYEGSVVFVPSTKDKTGKLRTGDEMAFSLQSACAAAARRYGKELPAKANSKGKMIKQYELDRKFMTQAVNDGQGPNGQTGAYIYRAYLEPGQSAA